MEGKWLYVYVVSASLLLYHLLQSEFINVKLPNSLSLGIYNVDVDKSDKRVI